MNTKNNDFSAIKKEKMWSKISTIVALITIIFWLLIFTHIFEFNYDQFFFYLTIVTGVYWLAEQYKWKKELPLDEKGKRIRPWWLNWTAGLFPIIAILFLVRGFVGELMSVPTGSMLPTIRIGDINITEKYYYDIKLPIIDKDIIHMHDIKRGDIVVFHYPPHPQTYFVKRFVGLPGDTLEYDYQSKKLIINGHEITRQFQTTTKDDESGKIVQEYQEDLMGVKHRIWIEPDNNTIPNPTSFPPMKSCDYSEEKIVCKIPQNSYFAMGDNRDNSLDSRYWGFVTEKEIVGRATYNIYSPSGKSKFGTLK